MLFTTVNRDRVRARGVEIEGRWTIGAAAGAGRRADLARPRIADAAARPAALAGIAARALAGGGRARAQRGGARQFVASTTARSRPAWSSPRGHAEADLGLRYRLSRHLTLDAALRNLTDSEHQDAVGFPAPGRLVRAATLGARLF